MISYIDKYRRMYLISKKSNKIIEEERQNFEYYLNNAPNNYVVEKYNFNNDTIEIQCTIQDHHFNDSKNIDGKILCCRYNEDLKSGDVILWEEKYYLIFFEEKNTIKSHKTFIIKPTNNILTFEEKTNKILKIPCLLSNATLYSDGVEIKQITLSNDLRSITIPYNRYTKNIQYLQRFIFNHNSVFEVTMIDDFTFKNENQEFGSLQLTLKRTEEKINLDDMNNNIADNSHLKKENPVILQIENKPIQIKLNSIYQLNPKLIQNGKEIIDNNHIEYEFDKNIIDINNDGLIATKSIGNTEIIVKYNNQSIKISVQIINEIINNSKLVIIGNDTARIGKNEYWNVEIYNNQGNKVVDNIKWSLIGEDIENLLKIKEETNETLKLLILRKTENIGKKFKIRCESIDGLKSDEKGIRIKSMF